MRGPQFSPGRAEAVSRARPTRAPNGEERRGSGPGAPGGRRAGDRSEEIAADGYEGPSARATRPLRNVDRSISRSLGSPGHRTGTARRRHLLPVPGPFAVSISKAPSGGSCLTGAAETAAATSADGAGDGPGVAVLMGRRPPGELTSLGATPPRRRVHRPHRAS